MVTIMRQVRISKDALSVVAMVMVVVQEHYSRLPVNMGWLLLATNTTSTMKGQLLTVSRGVDYQTPIGSVPINVPASHI